MNQPTLIQKDITPEHNDLCDEIIAQNESKPHEQWTFLIKTTDVRTFECEINDGYYHNNIPYKVQSNDSELREGKNGLLIFLN